MLTVPTSRYSALLVALLMMCLVAIPAMINADARAQPQLAQVLVIIGDHELITEVAHTPTQRFNGLSYRKVLGENAAMLFVYEQSQPLHFTMRHASIPLSIAFISESLVINEIQDMKPLTDGPWSSATDAKFALEVNQGWFAERGIKRGDKLIVRSLPDPLK